MGIQISFDTENLDAVDIAVLGALARSLADPEWAEAAEKPKNRGGRPKMTDEEKAEAAAKRAADKLAAEKPAKDAAEEAATEAVSAPVAEGASEEVAEAAPAPRKAPAKTESSEPAPEPETATEEPDEDASESDEDGKAEAVRLATALVHDGRGAEVRNALKEVGAKKVSDLDGKMLDGFLAIARDL